MIVLVVVGVLLRFGLVARVDKELRCCSSIVKIFAEAQWRKSKS